MRIQRTYVHTKTVSLKYRYIYIYTYFQFGPLEKRSSTARATGSPNKTRIRLALQENRNECILRFGSTARARKRVVSIFVFITNLNDGNTAKNRSSIFGVKLVVSPYV